MTLDSHFTFTRRDFLKLTGLFTGAGLLTACGMTGIHASLPAGQWAFCLHDYQLEGVWDHDHKYRTYPQKKAVPETVMTYLKEKFVMPLIFM